MLMNDNLEAVCWANDLANRYGVDTISTGSAIAFAMEAYEKGIITREEAGCDLTWATSTPSSRWSSRSVPGGVWALF